MNGVLVSTLPAYMGDGPIAPAWLVLPMAVLTLAVLGVHLQMLRAETDTPPSRRRMRTVNAVVMMATTISLAYSFAIANPAVDPRDFALSWLMSVGLLFLVLLLGFADSFNNIRLHMRAQREIRREMRWAMAELRERAAANEATQTKSGGQPGE